MLDERCKHGMIKAQCSLCQGTSRAAVATAERIRERHNKRFARADLRRLWKAVGFLAARAVVAIEARDEELAAECEDEYALATGEHVDVRVHDGMWGHAVTFMFDATDAELAEVGLPRELLTPGTQWDDVHRVLCSTTLGWALFELGFRVGAQDLDRVLASVPSEQEETVLAGALRGIEQEEW